MDIIFFIKNFFFKRELEEFCALKREIENLHEHLYSLKEADAFFIKIGKDVVRYELWNNEPKKCMQIAGNKGKAAKMLGISDKKYQREDRHKSRLFCKDRWEKSGRTINISGEGFKFKAHKS